jgi:cytochrome oxidase Cu insertion factor (SCO1/SenC/PrrC family)
MNRFLLKILSLLALCLLPSAAVEGAEQESTSKWGANYFPDYLLTNHHGEEVRFFSDLIEDKIVLINFIYTSCPDACPLETSKLRQLYQLLEDRMGKDIFFYSISIDPDTDTVPVLKEYAERWEAGPGWTFLRGKESEVLHLRKKLGLFSARDEVNLDDHQVNMIMGNQKTGRWIHRTPFESATILAEHLGTWLDGYRKEKTTWNGYENAPELRNLDGGEFIFRTRCATCHTIGGGDLIGEHTAHAGPDLLGVGSRRDPAWLARWVREPDAMIAEKDPIALAMVAQYKGVVMPNFRLTEAEVEDVLEFIQEQTEIRMGGAKTEFSAAPAAEPDPASATKAKPSCPGCVKHKVAVASSEPSAPKTWKPDRGGVPPLKESK